MKLLIPILLSLTTLQACATLQPTRVKSPTIALEIDKTTPPTQTKAGVTLTLVQPTAEIGEFKNEVLEDNSVGSVLNAVSNSNVFTVREQPVFYPNTKTLNFKVKIRNGLDRPLRLDGSIVALEVSEELLDPSATELTEPHQFKVLPKVFSDPTAFLLTGNKEVTPQPEVTKWDGLSEEQVSEINRIVVLPGKEKEIEIAGPRHLLVPKAAAFTVKFFDIATAYDKASQATARESFQWLVHYKRDTTEKEVSVSTSPKMLQPQEVARLRYLSNIM